MTPPSRLMPARVAAVRTLTPRVREFLIEREDGAPLPAFEAGAHVELHLDGDDGPLIRRYSLVRLAGDEGQRRHWRIAVQREPHARGSELLHRVAQPGWRLQVSHPREEFRLDRRDARSLLIAGGIGITPLVSMALSLRRRGRDHRLFYAGRSEAEMAYLPELRALCGEHLQVHADDRQTAPPDLAALLGAQPAGTTAYVCGPPGLIAAVRAAAQRLGWPEDAVRSELFGPPAVSAPTPFTLELARSGRTLTVGPHTSILEALRGAGLRPLFDCGRGECGLCVLPVCASDGPLLHRDRCLSPAQRAAADRLCVCVSRTQGTHLTLDA